MYKNLFTRYGSAGVRAAPELKKMTFEYALGIFLGLL